MAGMANSRQLPVIFVDYKSLEVGNLNDLWTKSLSVNLRTTFATKTVDNTARASARTGLPVGSSCSGDTGGASDRDIMIGHTGKTFAITLLQPPAAGIPQSCVTSETVRVCDRDHQ